MGQTHSAPTADAQAFRRLVLATFKGDLASLQKQFVPALNHLQISRATYLDLCMHEEVTIATITDSLEREERQNALMDEKMLLFSAVDQGLIVLGDTLLHLAVRLNHEAIVDFLLLTDHGASAKSKDGTRPPSSRSAGTPGLVATNTHSLNTTQTPNFKGELPRDVVHDNAVLRLVLDHVADVHDVFGFEYKDEPRVHRLVRALRRVWPLWMFEGQPEAASLVRVLYEVRSSDAAFGNLIKVALAMSDRCRVVITQAGLRRVVPMLRKHDGSVHVVKQQLATWAPETKRALLFELFREHFRTWQWKRHDERDAMYDEFIDSSLDAWLQVAQDLRLHTKQEIELPDSLQLKRYEPLLWKQRVRPPAHLMDDLCVHADTLQGYLLLPNLKV
ncbi:TPA: hypothetical protein N0F65_009705 [Lagenidium giganteum]|uniref:Uncharacterized protein n=1 Tax=Lagenidium giganteum TaxID=4803 RepID=A0AAV2YII5_9STRA|nr:TPA: hypothetical protein N0F65_009705 [Lagenidium giganteum]